MNYVQFVVGSVALKKAGITTEEPKDLDIITNQTQPVNLGLDLREDVLINEELTNILLKYSKQKEGVIYLEPSLLLTLKLSHINHKQHNGSWGKHVKDILMLRNLGYTHNQECLDELYDFWNKFYNDKQKISLDKKAKDFFKSPYNQSHDELHTHFCFKDKPMYFSFLKDGSDVMVSKTKWNKLSYLDKVYAVLEESAVIAFERDLPYVYGFSHLLTNLTKGWFNKFMVDNFYTIYHQVKSHESWFKQCKNSIIIKQLITN